MNAMIYYQLINWYNLSEHTTWLADSFDKSYTSPTGAPYTQLIFLFSHCSIWLNISSPSGAKRFGGRGLHRAGRQLLPCFAVSISSFFTEMELSQSFCLIYLNSPLASANSTTINKCVGFAWWWIMNHDALLAGLPAALVLYHTVLHAKAFRLNAILGL
jgi:hypothetical protein